jgi:hypothetical protein
MTDCAIYSKYYIESRFRVLHCVLLIFFCAIMLCTTTLSAQETSPLSIFEVLTTTEAAKITISTDLTTLNDARRSDDYQPAVLTDPNGKKWKVEIKTRGKYRRRNGYFPPVKIKFAKKDLKEAGYPNLNEIKISLPYYQKEEGPDLVVREYLAYRMYESLTTASLRARLVKLSLTDSHVESWNHDIYAIFIEDDEELCSRLKAIEEERFGVEPDTLQSAQMALVAAFNYLIGNTDFEVSANRNIKFLRTENGEKLIPIPYDFDFSGLVNAPYAKPSSITGLKSVTQRFMMADGVKSEHLRRALLILQKEEKQIRRIIGTKHLKGASQREMLDFLDTFYDNLSISKLIEGVSIEAPQID